MVKSGNNPYIFSGSDHPQGGKSVCSGRILDIAVVCRQLKDVHM